MVQVLEPPVAETQSAPKKRGGGPQTLAGRMRSRENSVKSSLRSKVVFSQDMAGRILERNWLLDAQHTPKTRYEQMLIADMALAKARSDRAAELLTENQNRYLDRTIDYWEYDQTARALKLKKRIARDPERVAHSLSGFKQGAELMITTWRGLDQALTDSGNWDQEQCRLALDLMGVALELRVGNALLLGKVEPAAMAATVAREIARLNGMKEKWLDDHDEYARDDALSGLAPEDDPTTRRLQRYEKMAKGDHDKAYDEFKRVRAEGEARCKEGYVKSTLRPWDVDALIARFKTIQQPPGLHARPEATPAPLRRPDEGTPAAPAAAAVVVEAPPTVAPDTLTPAPAAPETEMAAETEIDMAAGTEAHHAEHDAYHAEAETAAASETEAKAPLSRRARKLLQRRLHEAERKAGKNGRQHQGQPQTS